MWYLIFIIISIVLLVGFFVLSEYETRGARVFATHRERFDCQIRKIEFILEHVNFKTFIREEVSKVSQLIAHEAAHFSLKMVRCAERLLTQLVKRLRSQHAMSTTPRESAREFVKTLSDFKGKLRETPPDIPDILER